jgi:hypothetical protein
MTIFYHSLGSGINFSPVKPGDSYHGSDRNHLSFLLEGKVGFAYPYLPEGWDNFGIYEILIPDEALVFLAKDGYDVPRDEDEDWDGRCILVTAAEAVTLAASDERFRNEVVFAAKDVVFGKPLKDLQATLQQLLGKEFHSCEEAIQFAATSILEKGLESVPYYYDSGWSGISVDKTLNLTLQGYYGCSLDDFESIEKWLINKPNMLVDLLEVPDNQWELNDAPRINVDMRSELLKEEGNQKFLVSFVHKRKSQEPWDYETEEVLTPVPPNAIYLKD